MKNTEKKLKEQQFPKAVLEEMGPLPSQPLPCAAENNIPGNTMEKLCADWLAERHGTIKRSTWSGYHYCVRKYILPFFGSMCPAELDENTILAFVENIRGRGLAGSTVHSALITFKTIIKFGVQTELVPRELLGCCSINWHRPESKVLTVQDSNRMKDYLLEKNTVFSLGILLCRGTGMRIGELCGLKWEDIDFSTNTIRIKRTISRISNPDTSPGQPRTILYIRTPKSHSSAREIPIPQYLIAPLAEMKTAKNRYLLTGQETCTEPRNVQKKFKTILKHCHMQDCNFHAMRHGFATACLEKGIDCKTVSSILGHASTRTTMDFYVHTSMRQKKSCIDSIE